MGYKINDINYKLYIKIIVILGGIVLAYLLKIIDDKLKGDLTLTNYIIIICTAIAITSFCFFFTLIVALKNYSNKIESAVDPEFYCNISNKICYAKVALNTIKGDYKLTLSGDVAKNFNLYTEEEILKKEKKFTGTEIWVLSYDLTTEALNDKASKIVSDNLKKKIIYREFYIEETSNGRQNQEKMEELYADYVSDKDKRLFFYPYKCSGSTLNCLYSLYGIVIYISKSYRTTHLEAYFSIRASNPKVKYPIYVKMPYCMTNKHHSILKDIMKV